MKNKKPAAQSRKSNPKLSKSKKNQRALEALAPEGGMRVSMGFRHSEPHSEDGIVDPNPRHDPTQCPPPN